MSVITKIELWNKLNRTNDPFAISPLLDSSQVGASSIDVRIGYQFILLQRSVVPNIDPGNKKTFGEYLYRSQRKVRVNRGSEFIIHPQQLVLGSTLEYVSMPHDLAAMVEGRSSWGRLGLLIATACSVAPGFKGCITLELVNDGEVPIVLRPGMRIAQLVFFSCEKESDYRSGSSLQDADVKYDCPTGPEFSRIHKDVEASFWC
ncbi:Deoxycytidine triphosphate deaminase [Planctomycetes bacterium Pan216]|uniref:Deoxycytidine triphosphate deaminase n=1 Tax=Kolteria novifilia TaxID=2527975 RepID=A0A518AY26_9BACT|nr:Deoxycytidine triphosphate deaminase [Planctomycetes bacterium Pan216]